MPLFLSACPSVLETELDTAEIITDEEFATVSRLDCIIDYHYRRTDTAGCKIALHSHGEAPRHDRHSSLEKSLRLVPAARKKVCLVPMSEVEDDLREMEKDLHNLHVQQIREAPVHRR